MAGTRGAGVTPPDLRGRHRAETRRMISDAALDLFEASGVGGTTVDEIARRAGVSPRTFFRYFPTKEDAALTWHHAFEHAVAQLNLEPVDERGMLRGLEAVYDRLLEEVASEGPGAHRRFLRTYHLVIREPALLHVSLARDLEIVEDLRQRLAQRLGPEGDQLLPRLVIEVAAAVMRTAFFDWAERCRQRRQIVDLRTTYAAARQQLRTITSAG